VVSAVQVCITSQCGFERKAVVSDAEGRRRPLRFFCWTSKKAGIDFCLIGSLEFYLRLSVCMCVCVCVCVLLSLGFSVCRSGPL